jgi:hypothetical protein
MIEKPPEVYLAGYSSAGKPQSAALAIAGRLNATKKKCVDDFSTGAAEADY